MENQTNIQDQEDHPVFLDPYDHPVKFSEKPKISPWIIPIFLLLFALLGVCFAFIKFKEMTQREIFNLQNRTPKAYSNLDDLSGK